MFCMAVGALAGKMWRNTSERRACRITILPSWDGKAVPVTEAAGLVRQLDHLPTPLQNTWIVKRSVATLEFLRSRGSANELDDHLRSLADNDSLTLETSYSLIRLITWAIPILGFLGTVLGITGAISNVTPEALEESLGPVTNGLALAFDATALALGLTMLTMFFSFVTERSEQSILEQVDRFADRELAHRFGRTSPDTGEFVEIARSNTQLLTHAVDQLVHQQTTLWSDALAEADERRLEAEHRQGEHLTAALQGALDRTLEVHASRLAAVEKQVLDRCNAVLERISGLVSATNRLGQEQHSALSQVCQRLTEQIDAVTRLGDGSKELCSLQESLDRSLASLAETGKFEEAIHSLTAAIHLLTARAGPGAGNVRMANRPGTAA
jgi:biopolymer transport protein ExbB/TolQ